MRYSGLVRAHPTRFALPWILAGALLAALAGCSSDGGGTEPSPLAPLVGTWDATRMVVTSVDDPEVGGDLIEEGASFTLDILASGRYTATLTIFETPEPENGSVEVSGSTITFDPDEGPPRDGTWSIEDGTLVIDGETSFDFNFDGTLDSAELHLELVRR